MRSELSVANSRWENICKEAASWQQQLQTALMSNAQLHAVSSLAQQSQYDNDKFIIKWILSSPAAKPRFGALPRFEVSIFFNGFCFLRHYR